MSRRTTPQKKADERAFPVRLLFRVPECGFGLRLYELHGWLADKIGRADHAVHAGQGIGSDALAVYLRDLDSAEALLAAHPALNLLTARGRSRIHRRTSRSMGSCSACVICTLSPRARRRSARSPRP